MGIDSNLAINLIAYAVTFGAIYGGITQRIKQLERKVDLHNHLVERMYKAESRLTVLEKEVEDDV